MYLWEVPSSFQVFPFSGKTIMSSTLGPTVNLAGPGVSGSATVGNEYDGRPMFTLGQDRLWWKSGTGWVISRQVGAGTFEQWRTLQAVSAGYEGWTVVRVQQTGERLGVFETSAEANTFIDNHDDYPRYYGDPFWIKEGGGGVEGIYLPRGSLRGYENDEYADDRAFVTVSASGHVKLGSGGQSVYGLYSSYSRSATGSGTGEEASIEVTEEIGETEKFIGVPRWEDQDGFQYYKVISPPVRYAAFKNVGDIWSPTIMPRIITEKTANAWIIGREDSPQGWWEGDSEPSIEEPVVYARKRLPEFEESEDPEAGYPGPEDLTVTFHEIVTTWRRIRRNVPMIELPTWR